MTHLYDFTAHLHTGGPRPDGAVDAVIKTDHVMTVRPHKRAKAHRPAYAVFAQIEGRFVIGARYHCGGASIDVRPIRDIPIYVTPCAPCERAASGLPDVFTVYAYYDPTGRILYIGQTRDLDARHRAHKHSRRSRAWISLAVHRGTLSRHETREAALAAEAAAIRELCPEFNVRQGVAA